MLRSQPVRHNFLRRKQIFLGELLLVSALFHIVFFFFLLVVYSGYRYSMHITVRRSGSLLPSYFVCPARMGQSGKRKQNAANAKKVKETVARRVPSTVIKNDTAKKAVAKQQQTKQSVQNKKQHVVQKQKPKEDPKKSQVKQQQKQSSKQEVTKKQQSPQKEGEKREQRKMDSAQSEEAHVQQPAMAFGAGAIPIIEGVDFDTLQIQLYIQNEISRYWRPPIGLPDDLACKIRVQIDNTGTVSDAIIEESSGVLVYDLSARSATNSLLLPCWAWGKEFTINFR